MESFLRNLRVFFSNNINIKVDANSLLNDFRGNGIILLFFSCLRNNSELSARFIYQILDIFFFKHGLYEIGLFKAIFTTSILIFLTFGIIVFDDHHANASIKR